MPGLYQKFGINQTWWFQHAPFPYDKVEWWDRLKEWHQEGRYKNETLESRNALGLAGQYDDLLAIKHVYHKRMIYEDIIADTEKHLREIFQIMGLNSEHIPLALAALKKDSQQGMFGKRGNSEITLTAEDFDRCDRVFQEAGLPFSSDMPMEEFRKIIC